MKQETTLSAKQLGMLITLASLGMLFGTLILCYLLARARAAVWPPIGVEAFPFLLPFESTLLLVASTVTAHRACLKFRADTDFRRLWNVTIILGAAFVIAQIAVLRELYLVHVRINSNIFGSIIYTLIVLHAVHMLSGLALLLYARRARFGSETPRLACWFWHFLTVVWLTMFALLEWR